MLISVIRSFLLFIIYGLFNTVLIAQSPEEEQLLKQLKQNKTKFERITILNDLNVFYQNQNLVKQKKILVKLKEERTTYTQQHF